MLLLSNLELLLAGQPAACDLSACPHEAGCEALFSVPDSFPEDTFAINGGLKIVCFFCFNFC